MKKMIAVIGIVLMLVIGFVATAQADPASLFSMQTATTNTDGSAIDFPVTYTVTCGTTIGGPYLISSPTSTVTSAAVVTTTISISNTLGTKADALYYCTAYDKNGFGTQSANSNEIALLKTGTNFFVDTGKKPKSPGILTTLP